MTVNSKGRTCRDPCLVCNPDDQGTEHPEFFFQQSMGIKDLSRFKGVAADELCQVPGLVGLCHPPRTHLIEEPPDPPRCSLPCGLTACKPAPYNYELRFHSSLYPHPFLTHALWLSPPRLLFSTRNGAPHCGQGCEIGLSQVANLQSGYLVQE